MVLKAINITRVLLMWYRRTIEKIDETISRISLPYLLKIVKEVFLWFSMWCMVQLMIVIEKLIRRAERGEIEVGSGLLFSREFQ